MLAVVLRLTGLPESRAFNPARSALMSTSNSLGTVLKTRMKNHTFSSGYLIREGKESLGIPEIGGQINELKNA